MKKRDFIAAICILLIAVGIGGVEFFFAKPAAILRITVNGDIFGEYPIGEDREIKINETNRCVIEEGKVRMIWADCPDQVCVHTKNVSKDGDSIVCLPNKVVLEVRGDGEDVSEIDGASS